MIYQLKAKVVLNKKIKAGYFLCILQSAEIAKAALPGQFMNIKVSAASGPLLRRPFGIHRLRAPGAGGRAQVEILYEVVGEGSKILSQKKPGESLDIIGPLGNGFDYASGVRRQASGVLVAGGMGVAPLVFLAEKIAHSVERIAHSKPLVLIGAKTKKQILGEREFKALGCQVKVATDDGSKGFHGKVTELLWYLLSAKRYPLDVIYACGPRPMLREIGRIAGECGIPAQVSLEEHMACGFGACLGCAVKTMQGYKRVCKDGPVFDAGDIIW